MINFPKSKIHPSIFDFRELAFFFPDFVAPTVLNKRKKRRLQRTLALIRPDALRTRKGIRV